MNQSDFLVIGAGIAGLAFALEAAKSGSVTVLAKRDPLYSSTAWAQGGIASVTDEEDSFSLHIEDTLRTGEGLSHPDVVEMVIKAGPEAIKWLTGLGVEFDRSIRISEERLTATPTPPFHLHIEGGHSKRRVLHHADSTGREIQKKLMVAAANHPNIKIVAPANAIDLITTHKLGQELDSPNRVIGAYVLLSPENIQVFAAKKTLVATGGAGKIYLYTSNPDIASGDGIAMCYRAGAPVGNLEFFQFHPTCLFHPEAKSFLLTEALRGEGAVLKRRSGERFMHRYHPQGELAPRDVVARAIDFEMKQTGDEYVLLDISHREPEFIKQHFPMIYERCLALGFDITKDAVPVVPAAHYCCGGVVVDQDGRTAIQDLYAAGECTHSGLHGANRLASNSLLEGVVYGLRAAKDASKTLTSVTHISLDIPAWDASGCVHSEEQVIISQNWDEIRRFMWNYVGIVRSMQRLERALRRSEIIEKEIQDYYWNFHITPDLIELRNLSLVANLVVKSAMNRHESRGLHYMVDFPDKLPEFERDTVIPGIDSGPNNHP